MNDATELAKELKEKEFSFQELVTDIQKKIKKQNHELNAFVALEPFESNSHELLIPQSEKGPLAGIPFPLKMLGQEKKGWLATSGSRLFETHRASHTSNYVRQAEAIGLVPFGQTNAPEFGFKNITDPVIYGPARNPWNLECTPGGSSGGAAAAVSSGIVPLAGASDGGGSIRIPASFCGLIGLKPSRGTMPVGPYAWRGWQGAAIDFGLTVSMRDTEALFYGMRSIHSGAPYQVSPVEWQTHPRKKRLKIAFCVDSPIHSQISEEAVLAVKKAVDFLGKEGHDLTEIPYPLDGRKLITSYYQMNGAETAAMIRSIETGIQRAVRKEELEPISWTLFQYGQKLSAATYIDSLHVWDESAIVMENLHQEYDLFLSPTTAFTAPKISEDLQSDAIRAQMEHISDCSEVEGLDVVSSMFEESLKITPYTQLANLTGQPAISLPTHLTKENMPLGIQFMAARGREDLLFQIGYLFEANHQFHLPNPWK
ncbi:TPA: amidase [Enterococcus faecium]|uniref:amidase n=1 Tax=Enterococcus faecium TaxID=1352 RepID=UPI001C36E81F|nr:amidase [Enterococcus faecium]MCF8613588.1 amidase [Enterococcus faecium]MCF8630837.1 amidase [Enterococcus faecium]MCF8651567.1 amidase [Enterococcus faecium]MCF8666062.1 amidase [Enterococcus faecium]MCF8686645.1 amidase [Enterococcus faecium]